MFFVKKTVDSSVRSKRNSRTGEQANYKNDHSIPRKMVFHAPDNEPKQKSS